MWSNLYDIMQSRTQVLYEEHHRVNRAPGYTILRDERGRWLKERIGTGKRILDIGCRDGALTSTFSKGNEVLGVDIDTEALSRASKLGIRTRQVDLLGDWSELGQEIFDVIVAGEVLEHLFHPERVTHKVAQHLSPGGIFLGSVPNAFSLKNRLRYLRGTKRHTPLADPTHITQFNVHDLNLLLERDFIEVNIFGLGRYSWLASISPNYFAFDIAFEASKQP